MTVTAGSPQQPMKLLVPTNFSIKSEQALDFALTYSAGSNTQVYLFHVFEDARTNFRHLDKLNEEYMDRMKQFALQAINRVAEQGIVHTVEQVHRRLAHGKPPQEILKMADGIRADMVIMGTPESGGAFKKLTSKIPCTLVLVKQHDY